jgi:hypothetical protein
LRLFFRLLMLILILVGLCLAVVLYYVANPKLPDYVPAAGALPRPMERYRPSDLLFHPQGTQVKGLHYDWFTALELPFSQQRFASLNTSHASVFDRSQSETHAEQPGNLPVGFARHQNPEARIRFWISPVPPAIPANCVSKARPCASTAVGAACPALQRAYTARWQFRTSLGSEPGSDLLQPLEIRTFRASGAGDDYDARRQQLRQEFKQSLDTFLKVAWNDTHRGLYPTEEGRAYRCFRAHRQCQFRRCHYPENYRVADAPVDYPQLWDMWTFDWVQWNGSAQQPMARNIGEALGVGATLNFFDSNRQPLKGDARYPSSVRVRDLHLIEETLQRLAPPAWPEELLAPSTNPWPQKAARCSAKTAPAATCRG